MRHIYTLFLKVIIICIAIGVLAAMIRFPLTEGRAANLDLISIYNDPLIIYLYIASLPFFFGLVQVFKLVIYVEKNKIFSNAAVKAVRAIQYCTLATIGFLIGALIYIRVMAQGDDPAGPTMLGLIVIFASVLVAIAATIFQKRLLSSININSENN